MVTFIIFLSILSWAIFVFFRINLKYFYIIIYIFFIFYYFFLTLEVEPIFFLVDNIDNIDNMADDLNQNVIEKNEEISNNVDEKSYLVKIKNTLWDYKYYILGAVVVVGIVGIFYVYYGNGGNANFSDESSSDSFDASAIIDDIFEKTRPKFDSEIDHFCIDAETVEVDGVRYNIYEMEDVDPSLGVDPEILRRLCIWERTVDKSTLYGTPPPGPELDALKAE